MVYKCQEDGKTYYWKKGQIVGSASLVDDEKTETGLQYLGNTPHQIKVIETLVFNVLGDQTR